MCDERFISSYPCDERLFIDLLVLLPGLASIAGAGGSIPTTYPTPKGRFLGKSCPKHDWTSSNIKNCLEILGEWLLNSEVIDPIVKVFLLISMKLTRAFLLVSWEWEFAGNELSTYLQACLWCGCLAEDLDRRCFFAKPSESPWICCSLIHRSLFCLEIRWDIGMMNRWHTQSYFVAMVK